MLKKITKYIITIILLPIIGFILIMGVHLLPTGKMIENVSNSLDSIESEFTDELTVDGYSATLKGNFTDSLMLLYSVYDSDSHSFAEQAMNMYRNESSENEYWAPGESLVAYLSGEEVTKEVEYSRYWHGYLVILKPLLFFFSYNSLRIFNTIFAPLLLLATVIEFSKKGQSGLAVALALSFPFLFFTTSFASLSLSICIYLVLAALLLQSIFDVKLEEKGLYYLFFLILGAMTSYFDFLTYPVVVLGFPLCAYMCLHGGSLKERLHKEFAFGTLWGFGYLYMWASKWIIADLFFGTSTVKDALATIGVRTGSGSVGKFAVIMKNLEMFKSRPYLLLLLAVFCVAAIWVVRDLAAKKKFSLASFLPVLISVFLPFAWWICTGNHSDEHFVFTCRNAAVAVFAILCMALVSFQPVKPDQKENDNLSERAE